MEEIGLRVKHMNIITYAQGHALHLKGNMTWGNNPINAHRFFKMAMEKYEGTCLCTCALADLLLVNNSVLSLFLNLPLLF